MATGRVAPNRVPSPQFRAWLAQHLQTHVVVLPKLEVDDSLVAALRAGARGYLRNRADSPLPEARPLGAAARPGAASQVTGRPLLPGSGER